MLIPRRPLSTRALLGRCFLILLPWFLLGLSPSMPVKTAKSAKRSATKIQIQNIRTALGQFEINVGRLPSTDEGLAALVNCPAALSAKVWSGPYLETLPKDAWGQPFRYCSPPQRSEGAVPFGFEIISAGADGQFETDDDLANIPLPPGNPPPRHYLQDGLASYQHYVAQVNKNPFSLLLPLALAFSLATLFYHVAWWLVRPRLASPQPEEHPLTASPANREGATRLP